MNYVTRKMKWSSSILVAAIFSSNTADAETTSQTLCFASHKNKSIELVLRKYLDTDIQQEVGALVKYGTSKKTIPLVYLDGSTTDDSMDYELNWLEVFDGKITG